MKKKGLSNIHIFRYLFLVFSLFLICIACNQKNHTTASNETIELDDPMEGVWKLISYCRLANEDTTFKSENSNEHKIYLDGFVMWNHDPDPDSSEWHGFGTYTYNNGMVTETLTSMSITMRSYIPSPMRIDLGENSFKQVDLSENNGIIYQQIWRFKKLN